MKSTSTRSPQQPAEIRPQNTSQKQCPDCGKDSIIEATDCLSKVLENMSEPASNGSSESSVSGRYCKSENCNWFALDRAQEQLGKRPPEANAYEDNSLKLAEGRTVSKFDDRVELNGFQAINTATHRATYRHNGGCPECGGDIKIILKRLPTADAEAASSAETEVYRPIQESCIHHDDPVDACDYHHTL